jgi:hypothetical protein
MNSLMLDDDIDVDQMVQIETKEGQNVELILDAKANNYSALRQRQRQHVNKQHSAMNLAQNDQSNTESNLNNNENKAHSKTSQLVSEVADLSIDNKEDLQLQVPLVSRNDAVYLGTVYMGSPSS